MPIVERFDLPRGPGANRPVTPLVLRAERAGLSSLLASVALRGDASPRVRVGLDGNDRGQVLWGPGSAGGDHSLARSSYAGKVQLSLDDPAVAIGGALLLTSAGYAGTAAAHYAIRTSGDTGYRARLAASVNGSTSTPGLLLGDGSATDLFAYRSAAKTLTVDTDGAGGALTDIILKGRIQAPGILRIGGTSFPASPASGDTFFRTDIGLNFYYDGTRWLSQNEYVLPLLTRTLSPATATSTMANLAMRRDYDIYVTRFEAPIFIASGGTALGASHNWVTTFNKIDSANAKTTISTLTLNSGASAVWRAQTGTPAHVVDHSTFYAFEIVLTKTGTPGNAFPAYSVFYRIIAT